MATTALNIKNKKLNIPYLIQLTFHMTAADTGKAQSDVHNEKYMMRNVNEVIFFAVNVIIRKGKKHQY